MNAPRDGRNCCFELAFVFFFLVVDFLFGNPVRCQAQGVKSPLIIGDLKIRAESGDSTAQQYLINFLSRADPRAPGLRYRPGVGALRRVQK